MVRDLSKNTRSLLRCLEETTRAVPYASSKIDIIHVEKFLEALWSGDDLLGYLLCIFLAKRLNVDDPNHHNHHKHHHKQR